MQKEKRRFEELDGRIQIAKQHRAGQAECKGFKREPVKCQGLNSAKWCLASIYSFQHVEETMWHMWLLFGFVGGGSGSLGGWNAVIKT